MIQTTLIEVITVVVSDCKVSMVYLLNQVPKNYSYTENFSVWSVSVIFINFVEKKDTWHTKRKYLLTLIVRYV